MYATRHLHVWLVVLGLAASITAEVRSEDKSAFPPSIPLPAAASEVSLAEIEALIRDHPKISILDVRMIEEVRSQGALAGSHHLDVFGGDFVENFKVLKFDPAQPCIIYCALGGRARKAAALIAPLGYKHIFLPEGGFNAWKKAGKPIVGGETPTK